MRNLITFAAVLTALGLATAAAAQPPGPPPFRPGGRGGPGGGPAGLDRLLDDLRLDDKQTTPARKAIDSYDARLRRSRDEGGDDLMRQVRDILTAEQYRQFRDALASRPAGRGPGGRGGRGGPGVATDDLVRHVITFDKDGDGKVTREELPE